MSGWSHVTVCRRAGWRAYMETFLPSSARAESSRWYPEYLTFHLRARGFGYVPLHEPELWDRNR